MWPSLYEASFLCPVRHSCYDIGWFHMWWLAIGLLSSIRFWAALSIGAWLSLLKWFSVRLSFYWLALHVVLWPAFFPFPWNMEMEMEIRNAEIPKCRNVPMLVCVAVV